jgi:hypothetical protein
VQSPPEPCKVQPRCQQRRGDRRAPQRWPRCVAIGHACGHGSRRARKQMLLALPSLQETDRSMWFHRHGAIRRAVEHGKLLTDAGGKTLNQKQRSVAAVSRHVAMMRARSSTLTGTAGKCVSHTPAPPLHPGPDASGPPRPKDWHRAWHIPVAVLLALVTAGHGIVAERNARASTSPGHDDGTRTQKWFQRYLNGGNVSLHCKKCPTRNSQTPYALIRRTLRCYEYM